MGKTIGSGDGKGHWKWEWEGVAARLTIHPPAVCFCLVSDDGIFLLQFDFKQGSSKFLVQRDLVPHSLGQGGAAPLPLDMALTEFHVVLLHRDRWGGGGVGGWGRCV